MNSFKFFLVLGILLMGMSTNMNAQQVMRGNQGLTTSHQHIVQIAAFTTKGDLQQLKEALSGGLDAGLTVNEIKEVLVHLYAYCGFPRSLQGINTFIAVLDARNAKGITDKVGKEATPVKSTETKYQQGKKVLETLTGRPETGPKTGYAAFSPEIEVFLKEHLFADIFTRDILSYTDREVATISALINLGGVEPMLRSHMGIALNLGLTDNQLKEMLALIEAKVGKKEADSGRKVLQGLLNGRK
jgi:alkylhydroperoxidase/carboxymuconolactone decarboxylase family protein YurZ